MFYSNQMKEKYENVVNIRNLSLRTLGTVLDFVYTGVLEVDDDVCHLLEAADYVQIASTAQICTTIALCFWTVLCSKFQD